MTTEAAGPVFDRFFAAYDTAFVLPDEKEERGGFETVLALNQGAVHERLMQRYGPFRELCILLSEDGVALGGANLLAAWIGGDNPRRPGRVTCNLNYLFIDRAHRGRGLLRRALAAIRWMLAALFSPLQPAPDVSIYIEQNDPFRLTPAQYALDSEVSGVDQFERLAMWARCGARLLAFPYVQPPLSSAQGADTTLALSVLDPGRAGIPAWELRAHLERFFAISVAKGGQPDASDAARSQLALLRRHEADGTDIRVIDPSQFLQQVLAAEDRFGAWAVRPASLLEAVAAGGRRPS